MTKAKNAGLSGGKGVLTIKGKVDCSYCKGDIKTMGRLLKLDKLTVHNNGKTVIFTGKDLNTVKNAGRGQANVELFSGK
jgi:hypothetical protein